jgi:uncharacterized protein (TIGR00297 family)
MAPAVATAVSLGVALAAWRSGALTGRGVPAATFVGAAILWSTGWPGGAALAAFFLPSTLVGRLALRRPSASDARGERRDEIQVLANGAAAAVGALGEFAAPGLGLWIATSALAAAAADTWATSLGAWSPTEPRLLLSGRRVPRGASGGVSPSGTVGGVVGALLVAITGAVAGHATRLALWGTVIGVAGMGLDSLLGATVQARFECPVCGAQSERRRHRCGTPTRVVGGWRWLDNDGVNALATCVAGLAGALAWAWAAS